MLKAVNVSDKVTGALLLELLAPNSAWHRSLWCTGIVLTMAELLEASTTLRSGALSEASMRRLMSSCIRMAGKDPALIPHEKTILREHLREVPRAEGAAFFVVCQMKERIERDYLLRWANIFSRSTDLSCERAARSLATYLLDLGFSATFLHLYIKGRLNANSAELTLSELCEEMHAAVSSNEIRQFQVLVAFKHPPLASSGFPPGWLTAREVSRWLEANAFSVADVRSAGGLILNVESRDAFAAADSAIALLDQYAARASIGTGRALSVWPSIWVKGHPEPFLYQNKRRGVRVKALYRESQVFSSASNSNVDAAIELLAHLENSSPTAAVAGGWAAIEGLLGEPGDRAAAADNLASLVACSIPRAALTALSYVMERACPELTAALHACGKVNRDRAIIIARLIASKHTISLPRLTDQAAMQRMDRLFRDPSRRLSALQLSISDAFHRLYRQRNLILHGGKTNSIALAASLRTVSKLAGAGIDRIAHGVYVQNLRPLELVARARLSMSLVTPSNPTECIDLLGA